MVILMCGIIELKFLTDLILVQYIYKVIEG